MEASGVAVAEPLPRPLLLVRPEPEISFGYLQAGGQKREEVWPCFGQTHRRSSFFEPAFASDELGFECLSYGVLSGFHGFDF